MVKSKWLYGKSFESYPIEKEWAIGEHKFRVGDLMEESDFNWAIEQRSQFLYVDPPWNQSNISSFYTKTGRQNQQPDFWDFADRLIQLMTYVQFDCFVEMGNQTVDEFKDKAKNQGFTIINDWATVYYKVRPSRLVQITHNDSLIEGLDLNGVDDEVTPWKVCEALPKNSSVLDVCTGRGLTALATVSNGHKFTGLELNPRRLANAIEKVDKAIKKVTHE